MKNKIRVLFQVIILIMLGYVAIRPFFDSSYVKDFEAYCPFGGISSFMSKLEQGTMSCHMSEVQLMLGIFLLIGVLLIGKLFCSYVCPIGSITEWLGKIGDKLKIRINFKGVTDRLLRSLKYILLFITLYLTMTTSELFCKEYDPFYGIVNLFDNPDIVLYFAIPTFIITILGTIFSRLFWCKYLCPLGAASNLFLNIPLIGIIIIVYIILNFLGAGIPLIWLVGVILGAGLISEVIFRRSFLLPFTKIVRNTATCTNCNLCNKTCPQGIEITKYEKVNHIDCNLCTDCVYVCPVKNTLTVNKKPSFKYFVPAAVVLLIILGLTFADNIKFTTISERWGNFEQVENIETFEMTGLKNVKCYGSAMAFKSQIEKIKGIYGVDAYASEHSVVIYYDPNIISEEGIKKSIFKPAKQKVRIIKDKSIDSLAVWEVGINNLFTSVDYVDLAYALMVDTSVYGFSTMYGEPVVALIYYNSKTTTHEDIRKVIEVDEVNIKTKSGEQLREVNFEIADDGVDKGFISIKEYEKQMFTTYDVKFNKYNQHPIENLMALIYSIEADYSNGKQFQRNVSYLMSHLSNNKGIVRVAVIYSDKPMMHIFYDETMITLEQVQEKIKEPMITITFRSGEKKKVKNPFKTEPIGEVKKVIDLKIDNE